MYIRIDVKKQTNVVKSSIDMCALRIGDNAEFVSK